MPVGKVEMTRRGSQDWSWLNLGSFRNCAEVNYGVHF